MCFIHSFSPRHTNFAEGGPGDISFHGFSYANLVEGNIVERIHIGDASAVGEGNLVHRNCVTSGPLTVDNSPSATQTIYANAMYGSDARLLSTIMPPVLPETPRARPYMQAGTTLFDNDGISVSAVAQEPSLLGNWYRGVQANSGNETQESYYGSSYTPLFKGQVVSGRWKRDCRIPAFVNASGL